MLQCAPKKNERLRGSCDFCTQSKLRCNKNKPSCRRCTIQQQPCVYSVARRTGRPPKHPRKANDCQEANGQHGEQDPVTSTPGGSCQQQSNHLLDVEGDGANFTLADASTTAQGRETAASSALDNALLVGETFGFSSLLDDPLIQSDDFLSFSLCMPPGEEEGHMASPRALNGSTGPCSPTVLSSIDVPHLPARFGFLESSVESGLHGRTGPHLVEQPDKIVPSSFSEMEKIYDEGLTFSGLDSAINAVTNNGKGEPSASGTMAAHPHSKRQCFCSTSMSKLQMLISHPTLCQKNSRARFDMTLFLEEVVFNIHRDVLQCLVCQSKSLHSLASLCICTDWVIEALRDVAQDLSSGQDNLGGFRAGLCPPKDKFSICVGRFVLDDQLRESCTRSLVKYRLRKLVPIMDTMMKLNYRGAGGALSQAIRTMVEDVRHKIESALGMMEL
uniref:Transcription activator AKTR-1 n=1 Tax=Alternaria alternata TaxID=5599 RepID=AKTR1_ALTAL|nr:RecName: Full=Transcription activator AKTR-1; AltName: Full=AK-toxin biosynthesis regulator 1 [Alternaria alternata]BAB07810.1 AktR-1 [Alternaria alternata]